MPTYLKDYRILVFHITNLCNPLHEPTHNPAPSELDYLSSFILFYEFLYFPLMIEHAMHSVAILNKVMPIASILRVKCKLLLSVDQGFIKKSENV